MTYHPLMRTGRAARVPAVPAGAAGGRHHSLQPRVRDRGEKGVRLSLVLEYIHYPIINSADTKDMLLSDLRCVTARMGEPRFALAWLDQTRAFWHYPHPFSIVWIINISKTNSSAE